MSNRVGGRQARPVDRRAARYGLLGADPAEVVTVELVVDALTSAGWAVSLDWQAGDGGSGGAVLFRADPDPAGGTSAGGERWVAVEWRPADSWEDLDDGYDILEDGMLSVMAAVLQLGGAVRVERYDTIDEDGEPVRRLRTWRI